MFQCVNSLPLAIWDLTVDYWLEGLIGFGENLIPEYTKIFKSELIIKKLK